MLLRKVSMLHDAGPLYFHEKGALSSYLIILFLIQTTVIWCGVVRLCTWYLKIKCLKHWYLSMLKIIYNVKLIGRWQLDNFKGKCSFQWSIRPWTPRSRKVSKYVYQFEKLRTFNLIQVIPLFLISHRKSDRVQC